MGEWAEAKLGIAWSSSAAGASMGLSSVRRLEQPPPFPRRTLSDTKEHR